MAGSPGSGCPPYYRETMDVAPDYQVATTAAASNPGAVSKRMNADGNAAKPHR
jgi:hypothetical protein